MEQQPVLQITLNKKVPHFSSTLYRVSINPDPAVNISDETCAVVYKVMLKEFRILWNQKVQILDTHGWHSKI